MYGLSYGEISETGRFKTWLQYIVLPIVILTGWQMLYYAGYIKPIILPPPTRIAQTFWDLLRTGELLRHIGISILRVVEGFGIAALFGLGLGVAIGLSRTLDRLTDVIISSD